MESAAGLEKEQTAFDARRVLIGALERTSSRLEKRRFIAELLRALRSQEVAPAVLMLVAGIFPEAEAAENCPPVQRRRPAVIVLSGPARLGQF